MIDNSSHHDLKMMEQFEQKLRLAQEQTKILRTRKSDLFTFGTTRLPYAFLAESLINQGDTVIRRGEINTTKPSLIMGEDLPTFEGFSDDDGDHKQMSFVFGRGFQLPSLNFQNQSMELEVVSKELKALSDQIQNKLDREHDSKTAVISGPEDSWAFSLLIYAGEMTRRSAPGNIKDMMDRGKFNHDGLDLGGF